MHDFTSNTLISLFDIIGPVMIGPSSSHTAGAAAIGYRAFQKLQKLKDSPVSVKISLVNSFSDTGDGHKTNLALLAGCLGIKPEDERIIKAEEIAKEQNVTFSYTWEIHSTDYHPNTALIELHGKNHTISLIGYSLGGGLVETYTKETFKKYDPTVSPQKKTYLSLNSFIEQTQTSSGFLEAIYELEITAAQSSTYHNYLSAINSNKIEIPKEAIFAEMSRRWRIMKESIETGIQTAQRSEDGLFGDDAHKVWNTKPMLNSKVVKSGLAFSLAVSEQNARMAKIIASPTAGSCGIVPGTLRALQIKYDFTDEELTNALFIAGAFGAITAKQVELAGAVAGCQAEIGAAGAMAAAAGTYLQGGNISQMETAASLVLANLLGLTCDPILGKVEVPCILRNSIVTSMVFSSIDLSMAGIQYYIPYDEIVTVMKNVGADMHEKYRETSNGGLAKTLTACRLCSMRENCRVG